MSTSVVNTRYTSSLTSLVNNGLFNTDETLVIENLQTNGDIHANGSISATGDLVVSGNLTVDGMQTVVNSQELLVNDPIISVSYSTTGTPTADGGIEVVRGSSTNASLIWNETLDKWVCGLKGAEQAITTADNTQTLSNKSIDAGQLTGTVDAARIANASLALSKLSDSTVSTSSNTQTLTNKSIDAGQLTGTIDAARIANASIALSKLSDSTVTTSSNTQTLTNKTWSGNTIAIASGGTNNTSAYTAGSVIYSNGTSLTQDNANLYYASGTLGIGTNAPSSKLHLSLISSGAASDGVLSDVNTPPLSLIMGDTRNHSSGGSGLEFDRGCHWIYNADATNRYTGAGAVLKNLAGISMTYHNFGSYPSDGNQGNTNIKFYTTNNQSASVSEFTEKMRILYNGNVGIGTTTPFGRLDVSNMNSSTGTIASYGGQYIKSTNESTGTITQNYGCQITAGNSSTGTITANTAFRVINTNAGAITTNKGIQIDMATTGVSGNNHTIFASADVQSYLQGNLGIGIPIPLAKLHVNNTTSANSLFIEDETAPDSTPFVVDNAGNVGIGCVPSQKLHIKQLSGSFRPTLEGVQVAPILEFKRNGGSLTVPSNVGNTQALGGMYCYGYNDSAYVNGAQIQATVDSSFGGTTDMPTRLTFSTCPQSGTVTERMRIDRDGNIGIGITAPVAKLHVKGDASNYDTSIVDTSGLGCVAMYKELCFNARGRNWYQGCGELNGAENQRFILLSSDTGATTPYVHLGYDALNNQLYAIKITASEGMGIGTSSINASAVLDITSTTKGFLPPRTTAASVTSPAEGLMIYDTTEKSIGFYDSAAWNYVRKPKTFSVFYDSSSVENTTSTGVIAGTSYYRLNVGVVASKGDAAWGTNGACISLKCNLTSTRLAWHNINISYECDAAATVYFIVSKNPTIATDKFNPVGTIMLDSKAKQVVATNTTASVSLKFADIPTLNDTYYVGVIHSSGSTLNFLPYNFNWTVNSS